ncbi:MAG: hypothetical protein ABI898_05760 [Sphingomonadales bacterium]
MAVVTELERRSDPLELECPACGAIVEASDMAEMIVLAREHTLDAHDYDIPDQHVIDAVNNGRQGSSSHQGGS